MQQLRWYYLVGLLIVALVLAACGDDKASSKSEANTTSNSEVPSNFSDVSSNSGNNDAVSIPNNGNEPSDFSLGNEVINVAPQSVQAGDGTLLINVTMPEGYKFNDLAPFRGDFESDGISVALDEDWVHYEQVLPTMPLEVPVTFSVGQATISADLHIYWCEAINETLCFVDNQILSIPITVDNNADSRVADAVVALTPPE